MFLKHMQESKIEFDPVVFNFMLHPSEIMMNEKGVPDSPFSRHVAKGFIAQQRLLREMQTENVQSGGVVAAGIHAMFVYYAITRQTVQQWETIRVAVEQLQPLSERTIKLILNVFAHECGKKCGPLTMKALVKMFAGRKDMLNTCFILATARQREVSRAMAKLKKRQQKQQQQQQQLEGGKQQQQQEQELEMAMQMVPTMRFPKHEEKYILDCFASSSSTSEQQQHRQEIRRKNFKEQEMETHFPLLKRLLTGERKPFSEKEKFLSSSSLSSENNTSMQVADKQQDDDIDILTNLLLQRTSSALQQQQGSVVDANSSSPASTKTKPPPKFATAQQIQDFHREIANPTPETRSVESMTQFAAVNEQEKQKERFYEAQKTKAWMNGDGGL